MKTKHILALSLTLALLLGCFAAVLSIQAEPTLAKYDEHLVAYYPFTGDTMEERLADRAPNGSTKDNLSKGPNTTLNNGAAYIPSTKGEYLSIDALEGDTADLAGKTFYLEFIATGNATTYATDLISANRTFRYWLAKNSADNNYLFGGGIGASPTATGYKFTSDGAAPKAPATQWYYLAITLELTDTALVITAYNSADGSTYVASTNTYEGDYKPANMIRSQVLVLGKNSKTIDDRGLGYYIDQFRIYDTVMTPEQISELSSITPSEAAYTPTTEAPTTEAPVTTAPPTTEATTIDPSLIPDPVPVAGLYDENLIAYYDFEGDNEIEQFADKAPAGNTLDMLEASDVEVNNGVVTIHSRKGSYIGIMDLTGDTADLAGKTIYLTFTSTGYADTYATDLISASKTFRYWLAKGSGDDNYKFGGGIGTSPTISGNKLSFKSSTAKAPATDWFYTAITLDMTDNGLTITCYNSADGKTYVDSVSGFTGEYKPANLLRIAPLLFGKNYMTIDDRGLGFSIDEIRIYDRVLSADEVANLSYITPGQPTTLPEPNVTTPEVTTETPTPTVTTAKPTATTAPQNATAAPSTTTQAPATTTETPAEKKGCGAIVAIPIGGIVLAAGIGMLLVRRKED